jgi:hypothetical protein
MRNQMPEIKLDEISNMLSAEDFELVKGIVATRGKNKGCLRAAKPKVERHIVGIERIETSYGPYDRKIVEPDEAQGKTAYIWRMVAFFVSPLRQHNCMPCTADFDVPGSWGSEKRARLAELDAIVDVVVDTIKASDWHGVRRWGQAFGQIGTPEIAADGSIVYR